MPQPGSASVVKEDKTVKARLQQAILFSLKTIKSLQIRVATHFQAT